MRTAELCMVRLKSVDRGQRLNEVDLGLSPDTVSKIMRTGVRTTISLFEILNTNTDGFAQQYELSNGQLELVTQRLADVCGDCRMDEDSREELLSLDFPIDDDASDGDFEGEAVSAQDLLDSGNFKAPDSPEVSLFDKSPPIRNQHKRSTCVAFATTRAFEIQQISQGTTTNSVDYSEHFLYWNTKEHVCQSKNSPGTQIRHAIKSLGSKGICEEAWCTYELDVTDTEQRGSKPLDAAYIDAAKRVHPHSTRLDSSNIEALKTAIANGFAVIFSIPVYEQWFKDLNVRDRGIIYGQQGAYDKLRGGHAITLVGFFVDDEEPGESYFVFDNSWGDKWAPNGHYGPGRGFLPFTYISDHCTNRQAFILGKVKETSATS